MLKPFKTFEEQLELLKRRNLIIPDEERAIWYLNHISYYRLSGYTLTLRRNDVFNDNITFDNVMDIYHFDEALRVVLFKLISHIEISFRSFISYYHSMHYGPDGYLHPYNFRNKEYHQQFMEEVNKTTYNNSNRRLELFVNHHITKYGGFPIWVVVELLTLGNISKLFSNLTYEIKDEICEIYRPIGSEYVENWLHGLTYIRNICAHGGRLYNKQIPFNPRLSNKDKRLDFPRNKLFAFIFVMKKIVINASLWDEFINDLEKIVKKYSFVNLSYLGFPPNWNELLK